MSLRPAIAPTVRPLLLALLVSPAGAAAQVGGPPAGGDPLQRFERYVNENGRSATGGEYVSTYEMALTVTGPCAGRLRMTSTLSNKPEVHEYLLRFSALDPNIDVKDWAGEPLAHFLVFASSGAEDIAMPVHQPRYGAPRTATSSASFVFTDRPTADTAALLARSVIVACGGQPRDSAVVAAAKARQDSAMTRFRELTGAKLPPEQRASILGVCESAIRKTLRAPSSAAFMPEPSVVSSRAGRWLVMGSLEAQTGAGGRRQSKYTCIVDAFGKQFVARDPLVY